MTPEPGPPGSAFGALVRALSLGLPGTPMVAVMTAEPRVVYLDASGDDRKEVLVVAGFVASQDQWGRLASDWDRILEEEGVGEVKGFRCLHMKHLSYSVKAFSGWDEPRKARLLTRLGLLIRARAERRFVNALPMISYKEFVSDMAEVEGVPPPYALITHILMHYVATWCKEAGIDSMIYITEGGDRGGAYIRRFLDEAAKDPYLVDHYRLTGSGGGTKRMPPLQAADWLAYEGYLQSLRFVLPMLGLGAAPEVARPIRESFLALEKVSGTFYTHTAEHLHGIWQKGIDETIERIARLQAEQNAADSPEGEE